MSPLALAAGSPPLGRAAGHQGRRDVARGPRHVSKNARQMTGLSIIKGKFSKLQPTSSELLQKHAGLLLQVSVKLCRIFLLGNTIEH